MPAFTFTSPEGKKYTVNGPEGSTKEQAFQVLQKQIIGGNSPETTQDSTLGNLAAGAVSGAAQIGSTILSPVDWAAKKLGIQNEALFPTDRRQAIEEGLRGMGANPESMAFKAGQIGAEIAGTAGAGGAIAKGLKFAPQLASAVESGGFKLAQPASNALAGAATRAAGGALSGGAMSGMVNPDDATTGAALGAALPAAVKFAGAAGNALAQKASPEVAKLANRAKELGIDIPADRLVNSKPLNALAASLNYVPFSGRAAAEEKMATQINKAVSQTIGQDTENITKAIENANTDLGRKFDEVLQNNKVKIDNSFLQDLASHSETAGKELEPGQAKIIQNQIDEILAKAKDGEIDGQAAYNIKKTLDRIGKQNSPIAYYARDLKSSLMDALNRSLSPEDAAAFAKTRQQYGNMLALEKLAPAGAEGEISMGKLANLRNIRDKDLRDVVNIAAQFGRTRENPHGAAQRVVLGALAPVAAATGQIPLYLGGMALGRAANTALNSQMVRNAMLKNTQGENALMNVLESPYGRAAIAQANP